MTKNICKISDGDFFTQKLKVGNITDHSWEYCIKLCRDKKVLHIGCSDYPLFNPETNMHIYLSKFTKELHGCDPNGIEELREHYDGKYFNDIDQVLEWGRPSYDTILVPNIIEHLKSPGQFVEQLMKIPFKAMFVLVPNYEIYTQSKYEQGIFMERIHPDHYAWYSPYTLYNLFKGHINSSMHAELNFFAGKEMIGLTLVEK